MEELIGALIEGAASLASEALPAVAEAAGSLAESAASAAGDVIGGAGEHIASAAEALSGAVSGFFESSGQIAEAASNVAESGLAESSAQALSDLPASLAGAAAESAPAAGEALAAAARPAAERLALGAAEIALDAASDAASLAGIPDVSFGPSAPCAAGSREPALSGQDSVSPSLASLRAGAAHAQNTAGRDLALSQWNGPGKDFAFALGAAVVALGSRSASGQLLSDPAAASYASGFLKYDQDFKALCAACAAIEAQSFSNIAGGVPAACKALCANLCLPDRCVEILADFANDPGSFLAGCGIAGADLSDFDKEPAARPLPRRPAF